MSLRNRPPKSCEDHVYTTPPPWGRRGVWFSTLDYVLAICIWTSWPHTLLRWHRDFRYVNLHSIANLCVSGTIAAPPQCPVGGASNNCSFTRECIVVARCSRAASNVRFALLFGYEKPVCGLSSLNVYLLWQMHLIVRSRTST
jgi:hypothetical protein